MTNTLYELVWLYFIYAFIGWCLEVAEAAVRRHRFVNRGFVSSPLCPIYGWGALAVAIFLPELENRIVFLFIGGMIVTSLVEYMTGRTLERIFHRRWWDYSEEKYQIDGYVSLKSSVVWGIGAVLMIRVLNPLFCGVIELVPKLPGKIILWVLVVLLIIDFTGSGVAALGLKKKEGRIEQITEELGKTSRILENALTRRIQGRMVKSFPAIEGNLLRRAEREKSERFAEGCGFFKLASLFMIGAFLGDIVETIFCFVTSGHLMSRSSVVVGPFSVVWGLGCVLLTWILYKYREKSDRYIFVFGVVLGGAYEYMCSVFTEIAFGTVFWDYSKIPFNLGGRINLLYCFFWGIAAVVWMKGIYPVLSGWIEKIPKKTGEILCVVLLVLFSVDMLVSAMALARYSERQAGTQDQSYVGQLLDQQFPDEFIEKRYENLKIVD